jgi:anti-sigma regulatory factor (Ser/Thr protein kinase)
MNTSFSKTFERTFQNRLADLARVTEEAVQFIQENGIGGQTVYATNLAIEEMATNILKYGYDDDAVHKIRLRVELSAAHLVVVLEDDGHQFNPLDAPAPDVSLSAEKREPGGLGICLVRKFAEQMRYERLNGRNRLTITIRR